MSHRTKDALMQYDRDVFKLRNKFICFLTLVIHKTQIFYISIFKRLYPVNFITNLLLIIVNLIYMRINKYIASSGLCSRRKAEEYIENGQVTVNDKLAVLSTIVNDGDIVKLDGKVIKNKKDFVVLLFNKPKGITCTTEHKVKDNIIDYINYPERIFPIGRLDKDSQGLILLTNNGDLVNECLRKENGHEKEYAVEVNKPITDDFIMKMSKGVRIYNPVTNKYTKTLPCMLKQTSKTTFNIILKQGLNRQIRRMCSAFGYHVMSLKRIRFMQFKLDVEEGKYRLLNNQEIEKLNTNNHNY